MQNLMNLINDHQVLDQMAADIMALSASEPDAAAGYRMLGAFKARLDDHLADEADFLYEDHMRADPTRMDDEVRRFTRAFEDLTAQWGRYLVEWTEDGMSRDWDGFVRSSQAIMQRMRQRIAQENAVLYPLALQHSRIRLRAA